MILSINKIQSRKLQNTLFIVLVLIIELFNFFELNNANYLIEHAIWLHILKGFVLCGVAYLNLLVFIPNFLKPKKYFWFSLVNLITGILFSFSLFLITILAYNNINLESQPFEHHTIFTISIIQVILVIIGSTLVYFIKEWYKLKDVANKLITIEKEKIETEHQALKAQLNPHFLFNTLNNLYAQCVAKADDAPKTVLKLSGLMSYILYECSDEYVVMQKEIDFLNDYISLEKLRMKKLKVSFNTNSDTSFESMKIAPLLFIPFVENAFKHSRTDALAPFIEISLEVMHNKLKFVCKNSVGNEKTNVANKYHGVGIQNVKKRLNLIYPKKNILNISEKEDNYTVNLEISF